MCRAACCPDSRSGLISQPSFVLVVLTQAETDSSIRRVEVEVRPPTDDDPLVVEYELPEAVPASPVTRNTPSIGSFSAMMKKANPCSLPLPEAGLGRSARSRASSAAAVTAVPAMDCRCLGSLLTH